MVVTTSPEAATKGLAATRMGLAATTECPEATKGLAAASGGLVATTECLEAMRGLAAMSRGLAATRASPEAATRGLAAMSRLSLDDRKACSPKVLRWLWLDGCGGIDEAKENWSPRSLEPLLL